MLLSFLLCSTLVCFAKKQKKKTKHTRPTHIGWPCLLLILIAFNYAKRGGTTQYLSLLDIYRSKSRAVRLQKVHTNYRCTAHQGYRPRGRSLLAARAFIWERQLWGNKSKQCALEVLKTAKAHACGSVGNSFFILFYFYKIKKPTPRNNRNTCCPESTPKRDAGRGPNLSNPQWTNHCPGDNQTPPAQNCSPRQSVVKIADRHPVVCAFALQTSAPTSCSSWPGDQCGQTTIKMSDGAIK